MPPSCLCRGVSMTAILCQVAHHPCPLPVLTSGAVGPVATQLAHLTGCSVKALLAAALPIAQEPVLALPVARTHPAQPPRAWFTQCAEETGAAVRYLRGGDARRGPAQAGADVKGKRNVRKGEGHKAIERSKLDPGNGDCPPQPHSEGQSCPWAWLMVSSLGLSPPHPLFLRAWP